MDALVALDRLALLTNGQVARLLFDGQPNAHGQIRALFAAEKAAARTLQRLWEARFVDRKPMILTSKRTGLPYHHFVNVLTAAGAKAVQDHYDAQDRDQQVRWTRAAAEVSNQTVEHALAINDVHVLVKRAAEAAGVGFFAWRDDRQHAAMHRTKQTRFVSIPDAFFVLAKDRHACGHFLEIDLGTEAVGGERSTRIWRAKIEGYAAYFRDRYADEAFFDGVAEPIVLTVTTGPTRLGNMLTVTDGMRGAGSFWYATIDDLTPERLPDPPGQANHRPAFSPEVLWQPIWRIAGGAAPISLLTRLPRETAR